MSIDPLTSKYPSESCYLFAGNNPIYKEVFESRVLDIDGVPTRMDSGSIHGDSERLVREHKEDNQSEVVPTLPE